MAGCVGCSKIATELASRSREKEGRNRNWNRIDWNPAISNRWRVGVESLAIWASKLYREQGGVQVHWPRLPFLQNHSFEFSKTKTRDETEESEYGCSGGFPKRISGKSYRGFPLLNLVMKFFPEFSPASLHRAVGLLGWSFFADVLSALNVQANFAKTSLQTSGKTSPQTATLQNTNFAQKFALQNPLLRKIPGNLRELFSEWAKCFRFLLRQICEVFLRICLGIWHWKMVGILGEFSVVSDFQETRHQQSSK